MTTLELQRAVLALPVEERASLVRDVLLTLDGGSDEGVDQAWLLELDKRAAEVAGGTAGLVDWADARRRIAERLKARRAAAPSR